MSPSIPRATVKLIEMMFELAQEDWHVDKMLGPHGLMDWALIPSSWYFFVEKAWAPRILALPHAKSISPSLDV